VAVDVAPAPAPAPASDRPAGATGDRYKVDFHSHTGHSKDSLCPAPDLLAAAVRRGLAGLAVTDHDTVDGALQALALVERQPERYPGLTIIPGEEVKTREGELIALYIRETIPPRLTPEETVRRIRDLGGLVFVPHPFDRVRGSRLTAAALDRIADTVDGIEVFNARTTLTGDNHRALTFARTHGLLQTAGSDAHVAWEVGHAFVELDTPPATTPEALLVQLRRGTVVGKPSAPVAHIASSVAKLRKRLGLAPRVRL
jgi:predicted metal-dependent phosphoesterase TrpH